MATQPRPGVLYLSLGQRIRQLRQSRGLTQSQLGGRELSKSFVSLLERDRTQPSVSTLILLARRLGTSVDSLLGLEGNPPETGAISLLAIAKEAVANRADETARHLLHMVAYLAKTYGLEEADAEGKLLRAQIEIENRSFDIAWEQLESARMISERRRDFWRLGRIRLLQGRVKIRQREFPAAIELLRQALVLLKMAQASRDPARAEAMIALATAHGYMRDFSAAMKRYEEALRSRPAQRDPALRGRALWGLGLTHRLLGNNDLARENLIQAKDAFEKAEELADLSRVLKNLGELLLAEGQPQAALRHLQQALRVADRLQEPVDRASTLTEIGRTHVALGNLDEAETFAGNALREAQTLGDVVEVAEAKAVLAKAQLVRKNPKEASDLLEEALAILRRRGLHGKVAEMSKEFGLQLRESGAYEQAAHFLAMSHQRKP